MKHLVLGLKILDFCVFCLVVVVGFFVCVLFRGVCCGFVFCVGLVFGFCLVVVVVVDYLWINGLKVLLCRWSHLVD